MKYRQIEENPAAKFLFADTRIAALWLIVRVYVGWQWLIAGYDKVTSDAWSGSQIGSALEGFLRNALTKTSGTHPDVQGWYAAFLQNYVLPHPVVWSHIITYGELLVGIALIVGAFTGIAAFFGLFMNWNYLLAGTVSINPILFLLSIVLLLAWRVAGYYGLDYWLIPLFGVPWRRRKPGMPLTAGKTP